MTSRPAGPRPLAVGAAAGLAACLFIALFRFRRLGPLDFWAGLSMTVALITVLAFTIDRGYGRRLRDDLRTGLVRKVLIGVASAALLYGLFAVGRAAAVALFPFAAGGIGRVYALGQGAPVLRLVLLIGLVVGPGEELFWRGFFQERASAGTTPKSGFALTSLLYTSVHLASANPMLILAAAVCGLFWGWLYLRYRSPFLNVVSHTLWDLAVFVAFPF